MKIYFVLSARKQHNTFEGNIINVGEPYCYVTPRKYHSRKVIFNNEISARTWIKNYINQFRGEFSVRMEEFRSRFENISSEEDREELYNDISEFIDEKQDNLSNMPQQLQDNHVLNEQIEELQELLEETENFELY